MIESKNDKKTNLNQCNPGITPAFPSFQAGAGVRKKAGVCRGRGRGRDPGLSIELTPMWFGTSTGGLCERYVMYAAFLPVPALGNGCRSSTTRSIWLLKPSCQPWCTTHVDYSECLLRERNPTVCLAASRVFPMKVSQSDTEFKDWRASKRFLVSIVNPLKHG